MKFVVSYPQAEPYEGYPVWGPYTMPTVPKVQGEPSEFASTQARP